MANLRTRVTQQKSRFGLIERAVDDALDMDSSSFTRSFLTTNLEVLESNWTRFQTEHDKICQLDTGNLEDESYFRTKTYERCQQFYIQARSALLNHQEVLELSNPASQTSETTMPGSTSNNRRNVLPRITIPQFSGEYNSWRSFHDLFTSMVINNPEINAVERMHYLKTNLSGEAARLILSLPVSSDTFSITWNTLTSCYENKRILISTQLDRLLNLKPLKSKSAKELSQLLSNITESLNALQALDCTSLQEDPFLIHLIVGLLDMETREAWELKLGASTEYPTYNQLHEFLISRSRALERLNSSSSTTSHQTNRFSQYPPKQDLRTRSYVVAATHTKDGNTCHFCNSFHFLSSCPKYLAYDVHRRLQEVKRLKLCFNCLGSHISQQCSNFRRCKKCDKKHHTTLHKFNEQIQSRTSGSDKENLHVNSTAHSTSQSQTE